MFEAPKNDWPQNILEEIGITPREPLESLGDVGNIEVAMLLAQITPREKEIIRQRYVWNKTYSEIGKLFQVVGERIRQVEEKALRKLRSNKASKEVLTYGTKGYLDRRIEEEVQKRVTIKDAELEERYRIRVEMLSKNGVMPEEPEVIRRREALRKEIESLELTSRSRNGLHRAGCRTVQDIVEKYPTKAMANQIRNLGKGSMDEISYRLAQEGIVWPKD